MMDGASIATTLERARGMTDLSVGELWIRYLGLGGHRSPEQLSAYLTGTTVPGTHDYDLVAQALNDQLIEADRDRPVPYSEDVFAR